MLIDEPSLPVEEIFSQPTTIALFFFIRIDMPTRIAVLDRCFRCPHLKWMKTASGIFYFFESLRQPVPLAKSRPMTYLPREKLE